MTSDETLRRIREAINTLEVAVNSLDTKVQLHDQRTAIVADRLTALVDRQTVAIEKLTSELPKAVRDAVVAGSPNNMPWAKLAMFLAGGLILAALGSKGLDLLLPLR